MSTTDLLLWVLATYLIASVPFSVLIGKVIFRVDIRESGDRNPGATNVLRATGSRFWFIVAVMFDAGKGLFPVGIAYWILGITDWRIILIGTAALLGHAYPLFTRFRGGKSVAITGGIWTGIMLDASFVIGIMLTYWFLSLDSSDWAVVLMMLSFLLYLLLTKSHEPSLFGLWLVNFALIVIKHRAGLHETPGIKRWLPLLPRTIS